MKKLFFLLCLTMMFNLVSAQNPEPIDVIDGKYVQNDRELSNKAIKTIVADYPDALREVKKGCGRNTTGMIFSGFGGAILGGTLADAILGTSYMPEPSYMGYIWGPLFIGTGVLLSHSAGKKIASGVEIYNNSFETGYNLPDLSLKFGIAQHGIGFTCTF